MNYKHASTNCLLKEKNQDLQYDNNSLIQNTEHNRITYDEEIQEADKTLQHT